MIFTLKKVIKERGVSCTENTKFHQDSAAMANNTTRLLLIPLTPITRSTRTHLIITYLSIVHPLTLLNQCFSLVVIH